MKIRIKGSSLRFRLTKSEVATLNSAGVLSDQTAFGSKTLTYAIRAADEEKLSADFIDDNIILQMPWKMIHELYQTSRVGFDDKTGPVSLLVEKDFVCIDRVEDDQTDNYPNPMLECK